MSSISGVSSLLFKMSLVMLLKLSRSTLAWLKIFSKSDSGFVVGFVVGSVVGVTVVLFVGASSSNSATTGS
jgi:hypothetical protein